MGSTVSTFDALLKERYLDSSIVEKLVYPDNPLLGMLQKRGDTGMVGDTLPVPIITGLPQGQSGTFTTAQTNATNIVASKWAITAGDYYGVVKIGDKVMMAARTNAGAFLENKKVEVDGTYEQAGDNLSCYAWGNGGQALGRVGAISGNDITLMETADSAKFEVNMELVFSANDGSSSGHSLRTGATTLDNINRGTGVLTITASDITGESVGDYLFREGDFFGDQSVIVLVGVQAFITADDSPGTLWGVSNTTRATDLQRYSGCRVPDAALYGKTMEERIKILLAYMGGRYKSKSPTAGFMHPEDFQELETLMTARGVRALEDTTTKFGYTKIDVLGPTGRLPIYTDRHCPKGHFFALRMEDWWISSMGELLHPQNGDGLEMLRVYNSTDYEFRLISYPLLANRAPKNSGRCSLT